MNYFQPMVVAGALALTAPAYASGLDAIIADAAARHRVPVGLVRAIVHVESRGRCTAVGPGRSIGAMQVKPATARSVGINGPLTDCGNGVEAGLRYLKLALRTSPDLCAAVSSYNHGIHARPRCTAYGRRVLGVFKEH